MVEPRDTFTLAATWIYAGLTWPSRFPVWQSRLLLLLGLFALLVNVSGCVNGQADGTDLLPPQGDYTSSCGYVDAGDAEADTDAGTYAASCPSTVVPPPHLIGQGQ